MVISQKLAKLILVPNLSNIASSDFKAPPGSILVSLGSEKPFFVAIVHRGEEGGGRPVKKNALSRVPITFSDLSRIPLNTRHAGRGS